MLKNPEQALSSSLEAISNVSDTAIPSLTEATSSSISITLNTTNQIDDNQIPQIMIPTTATNQPEPQPVQNTNLANPTTSDNNSTPIWGANPPLPPGWDERKDPSGKIYYVDHITKTTSWIHPIYNSQYHTYYIQLHEELTAASKLLVNPH